MTYQKVRAMLDAVAKDDGHFDFGSAQYCMVGRAKEIGALQDDPCVGTTADYFTRMGEQIDITADQFRQIYCGHIDLQPEGMWDNYDLRMTHYAHMQDKAYCLQYCLSLVETWEAMDTIMARQPRETHA